MPEMTYQEKAFAAFHKIMSNKQKNMLESVSRGNKGELFILHFLSIREEPVLPSELSTALGASTARISALLGALEKKGQLVRDTDESNRRNILVTLTPAGRSRAEAEMGEHRAVMLRVFTDLGEADTAEFIRLTGLFFDLMHRHMP